MTPSFEDVRSRMTGDATYGHRLFIHVDPLTIEVRTNFEPLCERLEQYFMDLTVGPRKSDLVFHALQAEPPALNLSLQPWPREIGKKGLKEEFQDVAGGRVVRKVRTGMQFLVGSAGRFAVGDCLTNYNQIVNFINSQIIVHYLERGWQLCHAAGVVKGDKGLAIAAAAGSGKSTLALHLVSAGLNFASNDRLLISEQEGQPRMAGIPKLPRVNPGTLLGNPDLNGVLDSTRAAELKQMNAQQLWQLEEKYDVDIVEIYGRDRTRYFAPLTGLLVLTWTQTAEATTEIVRVDLSQRPDLLQLVMKPAGPFYERSLPDVAPADTLNPPLYLEALRRVPCYEARGRADFPMAVRRCIEDLLA